MNQIAPFKASLERHRNNLLNCQEKFRAVLPPELPPQKIIQGVMNALGQNEYLAKSEATSIVQAAMTAAVLGLDVNGVTGQGYIVPFKGKAQFIPGYKGYIKLAMNSGFIISGDAVREKDEFEYKLGLNSEINHTPLHCSNFEERGKKW